MAVLLGSVLPAKVWQRRVDRFEHFFGSDLARASLVGSRLVLHRGDAVVFVAVVPRLDGSPSELVWVSFLVGEGHRGDVAGCAASRVFPSAMSIAPRTFILT